MQHINHMLRSCVERVTCQGVKGKARDTAALEYCVGYEAGLIEAGVIPNISPTLFLISVRGYSHVVDTLAAREAEVA